jgi:hypothetical protein
MTDWPTKPLIYIRKGRTSNGVEVKNSIALRDPDGDYRVTDRWLIGADDSIDEWKEVTAVPTAALKHLQDAFCGVAMGITLVGAPQEVTSYLPPDKPSALDQAVAKVKALGDLPSNLDRPHQEGRLALLLGALATLQGAKYKAQALATIVCVCTTWVNALSVTGDSLDEARGRVESDPDWGGFTIIANIAGNVARDIDDGLTKSRNQNLLTIAHYALAWLTELIEKEEA